MKQKNIQERSKISLDISIIIVSWNVRALLEKTLASIYQETKNITFEVFVVDNSSQDRSAAMVKEKFPQVHLITNKENLGFAKANNQALKYAQGHYYVLLNPDTEIRDEALQKMVAWLDAHKKVGIAGPQLINPDGSIQSSTRGFPIFSSLAITLLKLHHFFQPKSIRKYYQVDFDHKSERSVDQVMGAALFIRKEAVEKIGLLDEKFWIWFEEADWCKRAKNAGWHITFTPLAHIMHVKGESFQQKLSTQKQRWFTASMLHYASKHLPRYHYYLLYPLTKISIGLAWLVQMFEYMKPIKRNKKL